MKKIIIFILGIIISTVFYSCSGEPTFPDPGLDSMKDVRDTVRRDTMDTYYLKMKAIVPNKVNHILILDGLTYQEIDRIDQYNGLSDFDLVYPIDLSAINEEKSLNYIVKVIDDDMRSYNKGFSLLVKPFSTPIIKISGVNGTLGLVSSVFQLNVLFETGLNSIARYKIMFENELIEEQVFDEGISEFKYSKILSLDMKKGEMYKLTISLSDNKGKENKQILQLKLIDSKKPIQIFEYRVNYGVSKLFKSWDLVYDPINTDRLECINEILYSSVFVDGIEVPQQKKVNYNFSYSDLGMVTKLEKGRYIEEENKYRVDMRWNYSYDENNNLVKAAKDIENQFDMRFGDWFDDNRVKGFAYLPDYPTLEPTKWHSHPTGENIMADVWHITGKQAIITDLSVISIPSYLPGLPPFIPERPNSNFDNIQVLLMSKYAPVTIHVFDPSKGVNYESYANVKPACEYEYVTNKNGRLEKIVKKLVSTTGVRTISQYYMFVYE